MRDPRLVVSDTSPLLNLALIDRLDLVRDQFSTIHVPEQVWDELTAGEDGRAARADMIHLQAELDALRSAGFWISDDLYNETDRMVLSKLDVRVCMGMDADDVSGFVGAEDSESDSPLGERLRGLANDLTVNSVGEIREIRDDI